MSGRTGVRKDPSSFTQRALMRPCKSRTKLAVAVAGYGDYKQPPQTKGFERLSHQAWIEVLEVGVRTLGVQEWAEERTRRTAQASKTFLISHTVSPRARAFPAARARAQLDASHGEDPATERAARRAMLDEVRRRGSIPA